MGKLLSTYAVIASRYIDCPSCNSTADTQIIFFDNLDEIKELGVEYELDYLYKYEKLYGVFTQRTKHHRIKTVKLYACEYIGDDYDDKDLIRTWEF